MGMSLVWGMVLLALHQRPDLGAHQTLSWLSLAFFSLGNIPLFVLGKRAAADQDKHRFTNVFLGMTALKMLLSLGLIGLYWRLYAPADEMAILPFFATYFWFTIFEVYFLGKIVRSDAPKPPWEA